MDDACPEVCNARKKSSFGIKDSKAIAATTLPIAGSVVLILILAASQEPRGRQFWRPQAEEVCKRVSIIN